MLIMFVYVTKGPHEIIAKYLAKGLFLEISHKEIVYNFPTPLCYA